MDIITLLKANIRHKKGSFVGIVLLMVIVTMSLHSINSATEGALSATEKELDRLNSGDIFVGLFEMAPEGYVEKIGGSSLVKEVREDETIRVKRLACGDNATGNGAFILPQDDRYRVLSADMSSYLEKAPSLKEGEIYVSLGLKNYLKDCNIGSALTVETNSGNYRFTVKGYVAEPVMGSSTIGIKQLSINPVDYEKIVSAGEGVTASLLHIYKNDDVKLSDLGFRRALNKETGFLSSVENVSLTRSQSIMYTSLFSKTVLDVLKVFVLMLFAAVLIVMGYSITTGVEMEYVALGVLKSQGYTNGKIRAVLLLQYILAEVMGMVIGLFLAIPLTAAINKIVLPMNALLSENRLFHWESMVLTLLILLISVVYALWSTRKVGTISPVRAIAGGSSEIYFTKRGNLPISGRFLPASLAYRQLISAKRNYLGMLLIVVLLVFFMITATLSGNTLRSRETMEAMGMLWSECDIGPKEDLDDEKLQEIFSSIEEIDKIRSMYASTGKYCSIDGEQVFTFAHKYADKIKGISQGRAPKYENEVIITDFVAEAFHTDIGKKIIIAGSEGQKEFLVVGKFQSLNDAGMCAAVNSDGGKLLGMDARNGMIGISLESGYDKAKETADMLNEKYSELLVAKWNDGSEISMYTDATDAINVAVYLLSAIFSLVVISMVCRKTFIRERTDIGIYKALGFTSMNLRLQFGFRFLLVGILGAVIGAGLSALLSGPLLGIMLTIIGISNYPVIFTVQTVIVPMAAVCAMFFLLSFVASTRVKKVEVRSLIVE